LSLFLIVFFLVGVSADEFNQVADELFDDGGYQEGGFEDYGEYNQEGPPALPLPFSFSSPHFSCVGVQDELNAFLANATPSDQQFVEENFAEVTFFPNAVQCPTALPSHFPHSLSLLGRGL